VFTNVGVVTTTTVSVTRGVRVDVGLRRRFVVGVSVDVGVALGPPGVCVDVGVALGPGVFVDVDVDTAVCVGVDDASPVLVGVAVATAVCVALAVACAVFVAEGNGVTLPDVVVVFVGTGVVVDVATALSVA